MAPLVGQNSFLLFLQLTPRLPMLSQPPANRVPAVTLAPLVPTCAYTPAPLLLPPLLRLDPVSISSRAQIASCAVYGYVLKAVLCVGVRNIH